MFEQLGLSPGPGPRLELLYEITMGAEAVDVGSTPAGHRRIVHVTGGSFEGPRLWGRQDNFAGIAHGSFMTSRMRNASLVILDDCGHLPSLEQPTAVTNAVRAWLKAT